MIKYFLVRGTRNTGACEEPIPENGVELTYAEYMAIHAILVEGGYDAIFSAADKCGIELPNRDSPLIALLKSNPEAARLTIGDKLLDYRQGSFRVMRQVSRGLERIIATADEAEAANALAGG